MNTQEFLDTLSRTKKRFRWLITEEGRITGTWATFPYIPLTAVAKVLTGIHYPPIAFQDAGKAIGLSEKNIDELWRAENALGADWRGIVTGRPFYDLGLRAKLLEVLSLEEKVTFEEGPDWTNEIDVPEGPPAFC